MLQFFPSEIWQVGLRSSFYFYFLHVTTNVSPFCFTICFTCRFASCILPPFVSFNDIFTPLHLTLYMRLSYVFQIYLNRQLQLYKPVELRLYSLVNTL
jgi:hypothetical protein